MPERSRCETVTPPLNQSTLIGGEVSQFPDDSWIIDASIYEGQRVPEPSTTRASTTSVPPEFDVDHLVDAFTNPTCGLLLVWQYESANDQMSEAELERLVQFIQHPSFKRGARRL